MMISGIAFLGGGYALSFLSGTFAVLGGAIAERCEACRPYGRWLFLPVIGPYFSMAREAPRRPSQIYAGILGVAQTLGVVLLVAGGISRNRRHEAPVSFGVGPGNIDLTLRF